MASITLAYATRSFPVGTTVGCYPDSGLGGDAGEPSGGVIAEEAVAPDGSLSYTDLDYQTNYVCYAPVESQARYLRFTTDAAPVPTTGDINPPDGIEVGESIEWDGEEFVRADFAEDSDLLGKQDEAVIIANGLGIVEHGSTAETPRPDGFAVIQWVGSVTPTNAADGDLWVDTS